MKAAVYYKNDDVRVEERPVPEIGPGEILVRVESSGICGSDVMEWYRIKKAPLVLGHEIAGLVEDTADGVTAFKPGDRVTVAHHIPCNTCRWCLAGRHSVCDTLRTTNFDPGGFAEFIRVPAINVDRGTYKLPENVSFDEGSFSEPLGCVIRGFRVSGFTPGQSVLVIGSGMAGLLHIKLARALGAGKIIATDINDYRTEAATKAGADVVIRGDREDVPALVREATGGFGADFVSICAGSDPAKRQGIESVDRGGTILFFAPKEPGETYPMPLFDLWKDNIKVTNSYASCPVDTVRALELMGSGRVEVMDLVSHRLPLAEVADGFRMAAAAGESLKVIIECQR